MMRGILEQLRLDTENCRVDNDKRQSISADHVTDLLPQLFFLCGENQLSIDQSTENHPTSE